MITIVHSPECRAETEKAMREHKLFLSMWPAACGACAATGVVNYAGTYDEPPGSDSCSECDGKCPRCGYQFPDWRTDDSGAFENFTAGEILCPGCGLEFTNPDVMPPLPEGPCECEIAGWESE